jgi:hypothetical protein
MNATYTTFYLIQKIKQGFFSYTIFPVKKINVGKILKLWEIRCLIILSIHILKLEISGCDKNHKSWMAKSSNNEPLTPLSLSPQKHPKMKEHFHLQAKEFAEIQSRLLYIGHPKMNEVPLH